MNAEELKSIPLFESLSDDARRELAVWLDEVKVSEGKHLVDEGDYAYDLSVIVDGTAEVTRDGEHVAELGPGEFFGEMGVLSEEGRRKATVVAKSDMKLLSLREYDVDRMRKTAPEMIDELVAVLRERSGGS
ncbi:MAG: family transcriptional regulator, cyclic receptor protein [Thermoleophilaceae bacterium]|jgi:CRP-like cAMP-binding protein|nr:family transcriptional regulator, cyclic receptor protein [Thermoleophilaceae bacterium]MEA2369418.1 family transcriptional regulator, cyclic receptor protein [Thermoleophilaceae bacterium]